MRSRIAPRGLHARRTIGRDRDHRHPGRVLAAGGPGCSRIGAAHPMPEQFQADRPGRANPSRYARSNSRWAAIRSINTPFRGRSSCCPYMEETSDLQQLEFEGPRLRSSRTARPCVRRLKPTPAPADAVRPPIETSTTTTRRPPDAIGVATLADYSANAGIQLMTGMVDAERRHQRFRPDTAALKPDRFSAAHTSAPGKSKTDCRRRSRSPSDICRRCRPTRLRKWKTMKSATRPRSPATRRTRRSAAPKTAWPTSIDDPDRNKFGSSHSGGVVQAVFLDGHVRGLRPDIAIAVLKALSTIGGGEIVPDDD